MTHSVPTHRRITPLFLRLLPCAIVAAIAAVDTAAAGAPPAGPSALVIHGGDRTLAAIEAPAGPPHLNLATLGAFPNEIVVRGTKAYVVTSGANAIDVIDLLTGSVVQTISTGVGTNPYGLAFLDDTRLYVSRLATNDVLAIDLPGGTIAATIPVGRSPEGVAVAAGRLFVANSGFDFGTYGYDAGTISVIDPGSNSVMATLPVGLNPQALAAAPNGELHVVCTGDYFSVFGRAFVIDPTAVAVVDSVELGASPGNIAVSPSGAAYLGDYFAGLLRYDTASRAVLRDGSNPIAVGTGAGGIDFGGGLTWVCLYSDDAVITLDAGDLVTQTFPVGDGPQDLVFYTPTPPVPVALASFTGRFESGHARLAWDTTGDDAAGFHVERADAADGAWTRRTAAPIAARADGHYAWRDPEPSDGRGHVSYRLVGVDRAGRMEILAPLTLTVDAPLAGLMVAPPTPNPFRGGRMTLSLRLREAGPVAVAFYDAAGRRVRRLDVPTLAAGSHDLQWDGRDDDGRPVARGLYFVQVDAAGARQSRRLIVLDR